MGLRHPWPMGVMSNGSTVPSPLCWTQNSRAGGPEVQRGVHPVLPHLRLGTRWSLHLEHFTSSKFKLKSCLLWKSSSPFLFKPNLPCPHDSFMPPPFFPHLLTYIYCSLTILLRICPGFLDRWLALEFTSDSGWPNALGLAEVVLGGMSRLLVLSLTRCDCTQKSSPFVMWACTSSGFLAQSKWDNAQNKSLLPESRSFLPTYSDPLRWVSQAHMVAMNVSIYFGLYVIININK